MKLLLAAPVCATVLASAAHASFLEFVSETISLGNGHVILNVYAKFDNANDRVFTFHNSSVWCSAPFVQTVANPFWKPGNSQNKSTSDDSWVTVGSNPNGSGNAGGAGAAAMGDPYFLNFNDSEGSTEFTYIENFPGEGAGWYNGNPINGYAYAFDEGRVLLAHLVVANPAPGLTVHWEGEMSVKFDGQSGTTGHVGLGTSYDFLIPGPAVWSVLGLPVFGRSHGRRRHREACLGYVTVCTLGVVSATPRGTLRLDRMRSPTVTALPLRFENGHLFVEVASKLWLVDSGAPTSFGKGHNLTLCGEHFVFDDTYHGLGIQGLVKHVGVDCVGLLGADVLFAFDIIFDVKNGACAISKDDLELDGMPVPIWEFMGLPLMVAEIAGVDFRNFFFDTGAQLSYFQDEAISKFPKEGHVTDFFPDSDDFETETYRVAMSLGGVHVALRCGVLPEHLAAALTMAKAQGIIGNELMLNRRIGFFPRQGGLVLEQI